MASFISSISLGKKTAFTLSFVLLLCSQVFTETIYPISYEGEEVFSLSLDIAGKSAKDRAKEATKLLAHAVESQDVDSSALIVSSELLDDHIILYVRGMLVATIYQGDIEAAGYQVLAEYNGLVSARLRTLVEYELKRQKWQSIALKFFISVILVILGFFVLRQLKYAFDRTEVFLVNRQDLFRKFSPFGVPFFKNDSASGLLAFLIEICRWLSYITVFAIIFFSLLSQFEVTRNFLRSLGKTALIDFASSIQKVTMSIPGLVLAGLILLSLHIAVHSFNLLLEGVKGQKINWKSIPIHRVPVLKMIVPAILLTVFLPLVVAAIFQRYDTPIQWLVVGASLISFLGALPLIATWFCGSLILWRNELHSGVWVSIGVNEGEIAHINAFFLHLVPLSGGTISLPMFKVFLSPIKKYARPPEEVIWFDLAITTDLQENLQKIAEQVGKIVDGAKISPDKLNEGRAIFKLSFPISSVDTRAKVIYGMLSTGAPFGPFVSKAS